MNVNLDSLTLGQLKEIGALLNNNVYSSNNSDSSGICSMIGKKVIIRTYSAGVWFGTLSQKIGEEVILTDARRMYQWFCKESISLSAVAIYGICHDKSKICVPVEEIWLKAIEILPCNDVSILSITKCPIVKQS